MTTSLNGTFGQTVVILSSSQKLPIPFLGLLLLIFIQSWTRLKVHLRRTWRWTKNFGFKRQFEHVIRSERNTVNSFTHASGPKIIICRTSFKPEVNFQSSTPVWPSDQSNDRFWNDFGKVFWKLKNIAFLIGIIKISYKNFINSALPL